MREGSLDAPVRHPIDWQSPDFFDAAKLDAELRRVFDICHGCRRCFNLCDSFPRLFDLLDATPTGAVEEVNSADFKPVVDACTLCDMCFMTKCPYVPPHRFNLDFPHLMLRARAIEARNGKFSLAERELTRTDRNGKLAGAAAPLANWASRRGNALTRPLLEKVAGVDRAAALPKFHGRTFALRAKLEPAAVNTTAPAHGRKAALYATCFVNYNDPDIGMAARAVARELAPLVDQGWDIVALVPSCALMLKFEWPLIVPDDPLVKKLAKATFDVAEYVVDIARREGLAPGLKPLDGGVSVHLACHARAQNMGAKAAELLRLIPECDVAVIERCSGHGGSWGVMKRNFATALKVGKPVARSAARNAKTYLASECPLAGEHIVQGLERLEEEKPKIERSFHPIELFAKAYGLIR